MLKMWILHSTPDLSYPSSTVVSQCRATLLVASHGFHCAPSKPCIHLHKFQTVYLRKLVSETCLVYHALFLKVQQSLVPEVSKFLRAFNIIYIAQTSRKFLLQKNFPILYLGNKLSVINFPEMFRVFAWLNCTCLPLPLYV